MNGDGLVAWKRKTRQPRVKGKGVARRWRRPEEIKPARSALQAQPCPMPPLFFLQTDPPAPNTVAGVGPRVKLPSGHPGRSPAQPRAPRGSGRGPNMISSPTGPDYKPGIEKEVEKYQRGGRRTQEPLPPPLASCLRSLAGPSLPSPATHSPRLTSRAALEQEGGREHQQEKQKQAGEESHGAAGPVSSRRPRDLSAAPAIMALLFIRAPGGEGGGTYHVRPFATPPCVAVMRRRRG